MSRAVSSLQLGKNEYVIGDVGFFLYITSAVSLLFIGTFYGLLTQYAFPILLTLVPALIGMVFAIGTGALQLRITKFGITGTFFAVLMLFFIFGFGAIITLIKPPQASVGTIILQLQPIISIIFYGSVGAQEEAFWRGLYMALRKFFPGFTAWVIIIIALFAGGILVHQAVALTLFSGTIFSAPGYFLWIGISWVAYAVILEATKNFGVNSLAHSTWNVGVTIYNLKGLGII